MNQVSCLNKSKTQTQQHKTKSDILVYTKC